MSWVQKHIFLPILLICIVVGGAHGKWSVNEWLNEWIQQHVREWLSALLASCLYIILNNDASSFFLYHKGLYFSIFLKQSFILLEQFSMDCLQPPFQPGFLHLYPRIHHSSLIGPESLHCTRLFSFLLSLLIQLCSSSIFFSFPKAFRTSNNNNNSNKNLLLLISSSRIDICIVGTVSFKKT